MESLWPKGCHQQASRSIKATTPRAQGQVLIPKITTQEIQPMKIFRKNWKTFLGYGVLLLAFGLLLYYYQETVETARNQAKGNK
jgi:hypothetical protein